MRGTKLLLALGLSVTALGAVTASVVANNNAAINKFYASHAEKLPERNEGAAIAGNAFYVNLNNVASWWSGNNAETWVRFYNGIAEEAWVQVTQLVPNDTNVYEVTVPSGYSDTNYWTKAVVCRSSGGAADQSWSNIWNQTGNMDVNSNGLNGVRVDDNDWTDYDDYGKTKKGAGTFSYSAKTRIDKWAATEGEWNSATNGICVADGSTNATTLKNSWDATVTTYSAIKGADVKAYFSRLVAKKATEGGDSAEDLAKRYDEIFAKHPTWDNFAHR